MFDYNDVVRIKASASDALRPNAKAWIVGVIEQGNRRGAHLNSFPPGRVYAIEFEDGVSVDVHEADLERHPNCE